MLFALAASMVCAGCRPGGCSRIHEENRHMVATDLPGKPEMPADLPPRLRAALWWVHP